MLKELISLANSLDERGFKKEADYLDNILSKVASKRDDEDKLDKEFEEFLSGIEPGSEGEDVYEYEYEDGRGADDPPVDLKKEIDEMISVLEDDRISDGYKKIILEDIRKILELKIAEKGLGSGLRPWGGRPSPGGYNYLEPHEHIVAEAKAKTEKKPSKKQLVLDKNKNGKIDSEDFELLREKKTKKKE